MKSRLELIYIHKVKPVTDKIIGAVWAPLRKKGFNLLGYFDAPIGVAEVGRQCFLDLYNHSAYPVSIINYELSSHSPAGYVQEEPYKLRILKRVSYRNNIIFFNADYIADYIRALPFAQGTRNIGVFWWELEDYFRFDDGVRAVDEIFVFSDFVKNAVRKNYPHKKITKFSFPYQISDIKITPADNVRKQYGLGQDHFIVFFNFDFFSVYERKNPAGLVRAFARAFKKHPMAVLLLKTIHAGSDNKNYNQLKDLIRDLGLEQQVVFEDRNLPRNELLSLIGSTDIYVSLHRSEGLGIGMMEAMLLGKPVIATAYGGNMEFTNTDTSILVKYDIIEIDKDNGPYKKGYKWAEPDIEDAALKMEHLFYHPEERSRLRNNALKYLAKYHQNGSFTRQLESWLKNK